MKTYYENDAWRVTDRIVRTPRKTFALEKIDGVSLKRSFFILAFAPAIGGVALTLLWWRYLYVEEIGVALGVSIATLLLSFRFGTLKVEALSLNSDEDGIVFDRFSHLATIRDAIELAIQERDASEASR